MAQRLDEMFLDEEMDDTPGGEVNGLVAGGLPGAEEWRYSMQTANTQGEAGSERFGRNVAPRSAFTNLVASSNVPTEEDINFQLGRSFGLNNEEVEEALDPSFAIRQREVGSPNAYENMMKGLGQENGRGGYFTGDQLSEFAKSIGARELELEKERENIGLQLRYRQINPGEAREARLRAVTEQKEIKAQRQMMGIDAFTRGLSDEQRIFRTFQAMSPEAQEKVDFQDPRFLNAMKKVGNNSPVFFEGFREMDPGKQRKAIQEMQSSKSGGNMMTRIGGVAIPALAGLLMGPIAGGIMSTMMTHAKTGGDWGATGKAALMSAAGAGLTAGLGGSLGGLAGSSAQNAVGAAQTAAMTGITDPARLSVMTGMSGGVGGAATGAGSAAVKRGGIMGAFDSAKEFVKPVTDLASSPLGKVATTIGSKAYGVATEPGPPVYDSPGGTGVSSQSIATQMTPQLDRDPYWLEDDDTTSAQMGVV